MTPNLFWLFLFRLIRGIERMLQRDQVFTRFQGIERGLFGLELLAGVIRGFNGKADTPVRFVDLDDARSYFLPDFKHVLDLVHALFTDLRDVDQAVNFMLQADECAEARQLRNISGDQIADLVKLVDALPWVLRQLFDADRDALVGLVHFQNDRLDFIPLL